MSSRQFETIVYEKSGPVARLTMNRPDRLNGMTNRMLVETRDALAAAAEDRELRVLVLTGAGKGFCPGADIGQVASAAPDAPLTADDFRVPILLHSMPAVTIAAVNGACAGRVSDGRLRATSDLLRSRRASTSRFWMLALRAIWADHGASRESSVQRVPANSISCPASLARPRRLGLDWSRAFFRTIDFGKKSMRS